MSAALVLPYIWAFYRTQADLKRQVETFKPLEPRMAFYRKYTETLLRKYLRMAMEAGKVPSLMKEEMFRGKVTSYQLGNFDDFVIFIHDVDRCIEKLQLEYQELITRIALEGYTIGEAAALLGLPPRTTQRRYGVAIDRLTRILLDHKILQPLKNAPHSE